MLPLNKGKRLLNFILEKEDLQFKRKDIYFFSKHFLLLASLSLALLFAYRNQSYFSAVTFSNSVAVVAIFVSFILFQKLSWQKQKRKAKDNRMESAELKFNKIYDSAIIGLLFTRLDGTVTQANDSFLNMIGYSRDDLEKGLINWNDLTPENYRDVTESAVKQVWENGFCPPFEKEYIRKDGTRIYVLLGSSRLGNDEKSDAVTYIVDITDKKLGEEREKELNKQLRNKQDELIRVFMNLPALISIRRGPELRLEFVNRASNSFTRSDLELGQNVQETAAKFRINSSPEIIEQVYSSGQPFTAKSFPIDFDRDGSGKTETCWFDLVLEPLHDAEGNIDGVVSFAFDVSEMMRKNQELQESDARFRFLADAIPHKMWTSAPDGKVTYYNKGWYDYTGINELEVLRERIWEFIHPENAAAAALQWAESIKTGKEIVVEQRFKRHDGVYRWHLSRLCAHKNEQGEIVLWVGTSTDIHDLKVTQEALQVSEAHFKALTNHNSLPIWQADENRKMVFVNDTWRTYTGVTAGQITEQDWSDNIHPEEREQTVVEFNDLFNKRLPVQQKYRFYNASTSEYRWMLDNAQPVFDPEFSGYIGTMTDIHEQEVAQLAVNLLMDKKDEFLSIASHELKTPITSMKASLQLLDKISAGKLSADKSTELIEMANKQANKLTVIVNDLLDVTRIQSGKMQLNKVNYNFSDSIKECINEISNYELRHEFVVEDNEPVFIHADKIRIEQVVENFISNAIKYSPANSTIKISTILDKETLKCLVSDAGIGIPADKQAFIFDRFFRVHNSSKTYAGLGLGLYISAEIIKQHNGKVGMQSEEGTGSTFWFSLPLHN